jgi:hypothetical protein
MVQELRDQFNHAFTRERYEAFLKDLHSHYPGAIDFRVSETAEFIPKGFGDKIIDACESIIDIIREESYLKMTEGSIPPGDRVPGENAHPHFIAFDFGVCENDRGELEPQLIEMQGFPTLYGFEAFYPEVFHRHFPIPPNYSHYFNGHDKESYIAALKQLIVGNSEPENVILLEIRPHEQKTRIDFYCTQDYLGIRPVCITEVFAEGRDLYYMNEGRKTRIERIYNRIIFDDLHANREGLGDIIDIRKDWNITWITHPNWFYRISKYTLPFIRHPFVPETFFLNEVKQLPGNLGDFVLKPLFSFAGQGVVIDVTQADIDMVKDPGNWILQRKVKYADVIRNPTPGEASKVEIRMMYIWQDGAPRPQLVTNLTRLSKGKMIGVRYNKDKEWVGASVAFFEK